ncbi:hypothetical protein ACQP25_44855 (plasmid) [Microtetraspora malaysiensis]|uniref:hypothetical protein n=1 Tax=Microtetraspora malaysiensis TaxID=161358 RepID=UPI003D8A7EFD
MVASQELIARQVKAMKEDELRDRLIVPTALTYGWLIYWTHNSKRSPGGFPDLVLAHPVTGALLVRELKKAGTQKRYQPRADQQKWLDTFALAKVDSGVWTPEHWFSGEIPRLLKELGTPIVPGFGTAIPRGRVTHTP